MNWQMVFLKIIVHSGFEIRLIPAEQPRAGGSETAEMQIRLLPKHLAPFDDSDSAAAAAAAAAALTVAGRHGPVGFRSSRGVSYDDGSCVSECGWRSA